MGSQNIREASAISRKEKRLNFQKRFFFLNKWKWLRHVEGGQDEPWTPGGETACGQLSYLLGEKPQESPGWAEECCCRLDLTSDQQQWNGRWCEMGWKAREQGGGGSGCSGQPNTRPSTVSCVDYNLDILIIVTMTTDSPLGSCTTNSSPNPRSASWRMLYVLYWQRMFLLLNNSWLSFCHWTMATD